ncbi:anti-sigma factor [Winogradskyella sp.]|uniref:anti-sigma factor n=1 Tax=Winogradskyella sp. TaxID=1883156 RepID=UPI0025FF6DB7|nr:anti-sigma factor [Winogradskyella sp.]
MILGVIALGLLLTSCDSDDDNSSSLDTLTLNLNGLETLGADYVYEGWIIVNGNPVSTGTFTSVTFPQSFNVNSAQLETATAFVLTIEPLVDPDPAPADSKLLRGEFNGNSATVNTALIGDLTNVSGTFFLRTPTDEDVPGGAPNNGNDQYGVWYGTPGMPPTANLTLPDVSQNPGWIYEGWVIGDSGPISTGRFDNFGDRDDFTGFSGAAFNQGPPVPGEDFFLNAPTGEMFPLDVRNRMVVISLEPVPDDSPAPFAVKPLVGVAGTATAPSTHDFNPNPTSLPTGTVTR